MPKSPTVRGKAGPHLVSKRYIYDKATGTGVWEFDYEGTEKSIVALVGARSTDGEAVVQDGIARASIRTPFTNLSSGEVNEVRYEIAVEVLENEIWSHPSVIAAAETYDAAVTAGNETFREAAENGVTQQATFTGVMGQVVRMLRNGISGWEKEYVVVRRSRRIPNTGNSTSAPANPASIGSVSLIYTTAELGLPNSVAFSVPDSAALTPSSSDFQWGWRRRPSQVTFERDFFEQSSEFILAEWSTLLYDMAGGNAGW